MTGIHPETSPQPLVIKTRDKLEIRASAFPGGAEGAGRRLQKLSPGLAAAGLSGDGIFGIFQGNVSESSGEFTSRSWHQTRGQRRELTRKNMCRGSDALPLPITASFQAPDAPFLLFISLVFVLFCGGCYAEAEARAKPTHTWWERGPWVHGLPTPGEQPPLGSRPPSRTPGTRAQALHALHALHAAGRQRGSVPARPFPWRSTLPPPALPSTSKGRQEACHSSRGRDIT